MEIEQKHKDFLQQNLRKCLNCGNNSFSVNPTLYVTPQLIGSTVNDEKAVPFIIASCNKCGYAHLFNILEIDKILS